MQMSLCSYCKNANPQCKYVVIDALRLLKENIQHNLDFINREGFQLNYFIKNHNKSIPQLSIDYSIKCHGFILNENKKEKYEKWMAEYNIRDKREISWNEGRNI